MGLQINNNELLTFYSKVNHLSTEKWNEVKDFVDFLLSKENAKSETTLDVNRFPLRGSNIIYNLPFDSASNEWEANN
jgi:hypothetical protein